MIEDFTYDFTQYMIEHKQYLLESSKDIILRFYLHTHQFCDDIEDFNVSYIPLVFKDFLEENEEIYVNEFINKIYLKISNFKDKDIQNKIEFILKILGLKVIQIFDENNLEIEYKKYGNTDYRGYNEAICYRNY